MNFFFRHLFIVNWTFKIADLYCLVNGRTHRFLQRDLMILTVEILRTNTIRRRKENHESFMDNYDFAKFSGHTNFLVTDKFSFDDMFLRNYTMNWCFFHSSTDRETKKSNKKINISYFVEFPIGIGKSRFSLLDESLLNSLFTKKFRIFIQMVKEW